MLDYGGKKSDEISRFEDLLHNAIDVAMAPGNDNKLKIVIRSSLFYFS